MPNIDKYPFKELWIEFYEKEIKNPNTLIQLFTMLSMPEETYFKHTEKYIKNIFGECVIPNYKESFKYTNVINLVLKNILFDNYVDKKTLFNIACFVMEYIYKNITEDEIYYKDKYKNYEDIFSSNPLNNYENFLQNYENDEEFKKSFIIRYALNKKSYYVRKELDEKKYNDSYRGTAYNYMDIIDILKAAILGICEKDLVYKIVSGLFKDTAVYNAVGLNEISVFLRDDLKYYEKQNFEKIKERLGNDMFEKVKELAKEVYLKIVDTILSVELKRGDSKTNFLSLAANIKYIQGTDRFIEILKALGKETLDRTSYYYGSSGESKKAVMSSLLKAVRPKENDNAKTLGQMLEGSGIKTERLVEAAMYSPDWMDIVGAYLG